MNRLLAFFIFVGLAYGLGASCTQIEPVRLDVRGYDGIELPAGTFIPVENTQEISTQYCQSGYKVRFLVTNDLFLQDVKVIPESSTIWGYVEDVHDPVIGTNSSFKIRVSRLVLPDEYEIPIKGYVYTQNNNVFGGELTPPAEYIKMPHFQQKFGINGTLQARPGRTRQQGKHTVLTAGEHKMIILTSPVSITHTLTD